MFAMRKPLTPEATASARKITDKRSGLVQRLSSPSLRSERIHVNAPYRGLGCNGWFADSVASRVPIGIVTVKTEVMLKGKSTSQLGYTVYGVCRIFRIAISETTN